jgi:hypothetical protein
MQRDNDASSNTLDYRRPVNDDRISSAAVASACLVVGVCAELSMAIFFWMPGATPALNLPAFVIIFSFPLISLIDLITGMVSFASVGRRSAHWSLPAAAMTVNFLVAGYGIVRIVAALPEFDRAWGGGIGP